jgi:23S rRNA pseudouridine1911/1915/1917 synthase
MGVPWSEAKRLCHRGKVTVNGSAQADPGARVKSGDVVSIDPAAPVTVTAGAGAGASPHALHLERSRLVHHDAHVVVFDKPPGVNTVPFEEGERGALVDRLAVSLHRWGLAPTNAPLFVVHRLDRETSGLLVFGRTWVAQRHLAGLFRRHAIDRTYVALVCGHLRGDRTIDTELVENRGDGLRGSLKGGATPRGARRAVTHVRPLVELPGEGGATLVECQLETGRQHQIRIHLAEAGHPVVGEKVYVRGLGVPSLAAPRTMLHARALGFTHPARPEEEPVRFEAAWPEDFATVARRLGWQG